MLRHTLYAAEINLIQSAWEGKQYSRAKQLLDEQPAGLRGFEWHYWHRKLHPTWLRSVEVTSLRESYTGWNLPRSSGRHAARWALLVGYPGERATSIGPRLLTMVDGVTGRELLTPFDPFADQQAVGIRKQRHLTISDDASRLAVALVNNSPDNDDRPGSISIRDADTGNEIRRLEIPGLIRDAALSPDGSRIAVEYGPLGDPRATTGQTGITIWNASSGELVQTLPMLPWTQRNNRILWSPGGERLLRQSVFSEMVGGKERYRERIEIVEVATGEKRCEREVPNLAYPHYAWSWSPDDKLLAIFDNAESGAVARHNVELWDADTGSTLAILDQTTTRAINSNIAFSPDGQLLAVACDANEIDVWEVPQRPLAAGESTLHLTAPRRTLLSDRYIFGLAFSADGRELHALRTGSIVTWDATAREDVGIGPETITEYFDAGFSADATKVAFAFDSGTYHPDAEGGLHSVWDLVKNQVACRLKTEGRITGNPVFSADGRCVALFRHATRTPVSNVRLGEPQIVIYDAQTGAEISSIPVAPTGTLFTPHDVQPVFRPDGRQIAALIPAARTNLEPVPTGPKRIAAWELPSGKQLFSIAINASDTDGLDYSRDGTSLVLATNDRPQAAAVFFDATTGERQRSISLPSSERSFAITNDQQMFVSHGRSESDAVFGDLATGQERLRLPGYSGFSRFAISPDGSRLVLAKSASGNIIQGELTFWSLKSGRRLLALQHPGYIRSLTFSPDGNRLLAAVAQPRSSIKPIQIYDATPLPEEPIAK